MRGSLTTKSDCRRGRVWGGDVSAGGRGPAAERGGAAAAQQRALHHRGMRDQSVRAAPARSHGLAARRHRPGRPRLVRPWLSLTATSYSHLRQDPLFSGVNDAEAGSSLPIQHLAALLVNPLAASAPSGSAVLFFACALVPLPSFFNMNAHVAYPSGLPTLKAMINRRYCRNGLGHLPDATNLALPAWCRCSFHA